MIFVNNIQAEVHLDLLRKMLRVRFFEEHVIKGKEAGLISGPVHTTIGQEAVDVGVCAALRSDDNIIGTHRSHGYMIAKGANIEKMMAEIYGKGTGTNGGKGGSMHVNDASIGAYGSTGIVGSGLPVACGIGFATKYKRLSNVTCVFFGDGAANEGTFHESLNLAAVWNLPIIFLLKNNGLAITTHAKNVSSVDSFYKRAEGYGIRGCLISGQDVEEVYSNISDVCQYVREGKGPVLVEIKTIRFREHQEGVSYKKISESNYRDNCNLEYDKKYNDPVAMYEQKLIDRKIIDLLSLKKIKEEELQKVINAVHFAECSPNPDLHSAYLNIY